MINTSSSNTVSANTGSSSKISLQHFEHPPHQRILATTTSRSSSDNYYQKIVPWTYADILPSMGASPLTIMMFHAPVTGLYAGSIGGTAIGTAIGGIRSLMAGSGTGTAGKAKMINTIGTGGVVGAIGGMVLGGALLYNTSLQGDDTRSGVPWDDEGIADRAERVQKNNLVRAIDFGSGTGILLVAVTGAFKKGFKPTLFGSLQAMSLGSAIGGFVSSIVVKQLMKK